MASLPAEAVPRITGWVRETLRSQIPSRWPTYSLTCWHKAWEPVLDLKVDTIWPRKETSVDMMCFVGGAMRETPDDHHSQTHDVSQLRPDTQWQKLHSDIGHICIWVIWFALLSSKFEHFDHPVTCISCKHVCNRTRYSWEVTSDHQEKAGHLARVPCWWRLCRSSSASVTVDWCCGWLWEDR